MSLFPLYDTLLREVKHDKDLTSDEKKELLQDITKMDLNGHQMMFVLIRMHFLRNIQGDKSFDAPFDAVQINKDYEFELCKLPIVVRQMIYKFAKMHLIKMEEESSKDILIG